MRRALSRSGPTWTKVTNILVGAAFRGRISTATANLSRLMAMQLGDSQGARRAIWFARQVARNRQPSATHGKVGKGR